MKKTKRCHRHDSMRQSPDTGSHLLALRIKNAKNETAKWAYPCTSLAAESLAIRQFDRRRPSGNVDTQFTDLPDTLLAAFLTAYIAVSA